MNLLISNRTTLEFPEVSHKIMLIGSAGSGKDTMASILCEKIPNCFRVAFADHLKQICQSMVEHAIKENAIPFPVFDDMSEVHRDLFRPLWQWMGTDFIRNRVSPNFWIARVEDRVHSMVDYNFSQDPVSIVITDCRFRNEYEWGVKNGYAIVRISGSWRTGSMIPAHSSETSHLNLQEDLHYENHEDIASMEKWIDTILLPYMKKRIHS